ncbi:hypothetical protein HYU06_04390 [Candidatus Woesearchaeota archaeon]|nr:hypothetical protein [Candidatus Woesearchaeota archaeon]
MQKSAFLKEEGDTPKNRVWGFLIVHSEYDYSMKDIARYSDVGYTTLKTMWKEFRQKKTVLQTRIVGKAKMYKLNFKNPVVNKFVDYYWAVVDAVVRRDNNIKEKIKDEKKESYHSSSVGAVPVSATHI